MCECFLKKRRRLHNVGRLLSSGTPHCSLGDHGARRTPRPRDQLWPPPFNSAQSFLSCTLQSSCSPSASDGLRRSWARAGDEGATQAEAPPPGADPGRNAQRTLKSSAFPSSLSWDSDSEKETQDEEELQHFSNPHGLAAHSPGSPSSGLRLSEDDPQPDKLQHLQSRMDPFPPEEHDDTDSSTKTEESNAAQLGRAELADGKVWNVSEGAELLLSKVKPKGSCQMEEEEEEGEEDEGDKRPMGKEAKESERDVYTFPGDSDPESPPPAPWAHCTFIQRCRKKRVLLRPFSGLGSLRKSTSSDMAPLDPGGGRYGFEEVVFGEGREKRHDEEEEGEERGVGLGEEIFTCVECSIYFKKQVHLQEHMVEHCQSGSGGGRRLGKSVRFRCTECGWNLPSRPALADHRRRHQESREKILEEIEKLNENGKGLDGSVVKNISPDPVLIPDPETVSSPPLSPVPAPEADSAVVSSDATLPNSVRSPAHARAVPAHRRRFICPKCNFSTRTSQALANHSKTHNRKRNVLQVDSPSPGSPVRPKSSSLACGHCAFQTSSDTVLREHHKLAHPGQFSDEETGRRSKTDVVARVSKPVPASEDGAAARPTSQVVGNRRFSRRGKTWADPAKSSHGLDEDTQHRSEEDEQNDVQNTELDSEASRREVGSPAGGKRSTRGRTDTGEVE
ncbi:unnamed protein product [Pleuronectes platessa]|uniref:C2H2-type domain-containing protein n=1 Tax=Pleuronectes platessa TaxID=8262 RepID=A0A9N7UN48_PLEPL|nr:unnamed protein product [Pleuronectes platessa]